MSELKFEDPRLITCVIKQGERMTLTLTGLDYAIEDYLLERDWKHDEESGVWSKQGWEFISST